jgi:hypothetical protein
LRKIQGKPGNGYGILRQKNQNLRLQRDHKYKTHHDKTRNPGKGRDLELRVGAEPRVPLIL